MGDLVVVDGEYSELSAAYDVFREKFESMFSSYVAALLAVLSNAVTSGRVYENLSQFTASVQLLQDQLKVATDIIGPACSAFVEDVDAADEDIY